jgi:ferritin
MTNLHLAILSTDLTLAILGCLWLAHRSLTTGLDALIYKVEQTERSLRSHVNDEIDQLQTHTTSLATCAWRDTKNAEERVINFVKEHAEDLRKHAEDLRNHAKDLSDRAEVKAAAPRQAVTRN